MLLSYTTSSDKETEAVGENLARLLEENRISSAFISLSGEMGVGKTAFARGFCRHFEINAVKSPTYTIVNEHSGRARVHHFDFYRITDEDDLYSIGFDDIIESGGYSLGEWCEKIEGFLPNGTIEVKISKPEDTRCDEPDRREIEINTKEIIGG